MVTAADAPRWSPRWHRRTSCSVCILTWVRRVVVQPFQRCCTVFGSSSRFPRAGQQCPRVVRPNRPAIASPLSPSCRCCLRVVELVASALIASSRCPPRVWLRRTNALVACASTLSPRVLTLCDRGDHHYVRCAVMRAHGETTVNMLRVCRRCVLACVRKHASVPTLVVGPRHFVRCASLRAHRAEPASVVVMAVAFAQRPGVAMWVFVCVCMVRGVRCGPGREVRRVIPPAGQGTQPCQYRPCA